MPCHHDLIDEWGVDAPYPEYPVWTTKEGKEIIYHDLEGRHLVNIIRYMSRLSNEGSKAAIYLQGEHAIDSVEREIQRIESTVDDLLAEADRRGLIRTEIYSQLPAWKVAERSKHEPSTTEETYPGSSLTS